MSEGIEWNPPKEYYKDENVLVVYRPKVDDYLFTIQSTSSGKRNLSLEQNLVVEFSRNDADYLSDKLLLMQLSYGMSRKDIERMHHAIIGTAKKYRQELEGLRKDIYGD